MTTDSWWKSCAERSVRSAYHRSECVFRLEATEAHWSKGKCAVGFTLAGSWLVTPDEVHPTDLSLISWGNSERNGSTTADLILGVADIVHHLPQFLPLEPGDLLLTRMPEGVALSGRFDCLKPVDPVNVERSRDSVDCAINYECGRRADGRRHGAG